MNAVQAGGAFRCGGVEHDADRGLRLGRRRSRQQQQCPGGRDDPGSQGHDDGQRRQDQGHRLVRPDGRRRRELRRSAPASTPARRAATTPARKSRSRSSRIWSPSTPPPSPWCRTRRRRSQNVLGQARAQGIKVVSHEATGIQNVDIDIEAFDNAAYGKQIMQNLAQCMGEQGKYVQFVGGLTAKTHMQWVGAAHDMQVAQFPGHDPRRGSDREHRQRAGRLREGQGSAGEVPGHQGLPGVGGQRRAGHRARRARKPDCRTRSA